YLDLASSLYSFLFLSCTLPPPPRSTPFPYTTLFRSLRLRTTCAPGRHAVDALEPGMNRMALESSFALIREAREWLRTGHELGFGALADPQGWLERDRKSTRLNSSHVAISYAVFCLKKKNK